MLVQCSGIDNAKICLPPFDLDKGEIALLNLHNRSDIYERTMFLKDFFMVAEGEGGIVLHQLFVFAAHIMANTFWNKLFPVTVGRYLKKNACPDSPYSENVLQHECTVYVEVTFK